MTSGILTANDGLPARESFAYAMEKLYFVGRYMGIFATGMKQWDHRVYLDLMAGCGRCKIKDTGEEFDGSPLLSLTAPFTKRVFVESHDGLAAALRQRVPAGDADIVEADCNDPATIATLRGHCPSNGLALAFVDNLGLDVPLSTLSALTANRRVDLMIVVQLQDLTRNMGAVLDRTHDRDRFDAFFGSRDWEQIVRDLRARNVPAGDISSALLDHYADRLATIGYAHSVGARRAMKNSQNATQYRLMLAGKHARAVEFFRKIEAIGPYGERSLFG